MPTTPSFALRYPSGSDNPNVPLDFQRLAEDTEAQMRKGGNAKISLNTTGQTIGGSYAAPGTPDKVTLPVKQNSIIWVAFRVEFVPNTTWDGSTNPGVSLRIAGSTVNGPLGGIAQAAFGSAGLTNGSTTLAPLVSLPTGSTPISNASIDTSGVVRPGVEIPFWYSAADANVDIELYYARVAGSAATKVQNRLLSARAQSSS